jgi:hypothetical protein
VFEFQLDTYQRLSSAPQKEIVVPLLDSIQLLMLLAGMLTYLEPKLFI